MCSSLYFPQPPCFVCLLLVLSLILEEKLPALHPSITNCVHYHWCKQMGGMEVKPSYWSDWLNLKLYPA